MGLNNLASSLVRGCAAACALSIALVGAARAEVRIFSYDPADDLTRGVAGALTFEFDQHLIFIKVLRIHSTQGQATAALKPASEAVLGPGGLTRLIGEQGRERDLYEVQPGAEGADLIRAFCPGSSRGWLAFGRLAVGRDLRVQVLGDTPGGPFAHLCQTFQFTYHGEWRVPGGQPVGDETLSRPRFPY
jgi:hypothetical protein